MLEIRRTAIFLDEGELLELERVITDRDVEGAFAYLRKSVYGKIVTSQRLQCHAGMSGDTVDSLRFKARPGPQEEVLE